MPKGSLQPSMEESCFLILNVMLDFKDFKNFKLVQSKKSSQLIKTEITLAIIYIYIYIYIICLVYYYYFSKFVMMLVFTITIVFFSKGEDPIVFTVQAYKNIWIANCPTEKTETGTTDFLCILFQKMGCHLSYPKETRAYGSH
jgi:hypothetical protein